MRPMLPVQGSGGRSIWVIYCKSYLPSCLKTHEPLDVVIILPCTNDLKMRFSVSAYDIANGAGELVKTVQKSETGRGGGPPQVLLLAPPPVGKLTGFAEMFEGAEAKSRGFSEHHACVAQERGCAFLNTSQVIVSSELDGIHLEAGEQEKLGKAVAVRVRELLASRGWPLSWRENARYDGYRAQKVVDAAVVSADTGRRISLLDG